MDGDRGGRGEVVDIRVVGFEKEEIRGGHEVSNIELIVSLATIPSSSVSGTTLRSTISTVLLLSVRISIASIVTYRGGSVIEEEKEERRSWLTIATNITNHQVPTKSHHSTTHGNSGSSSFSRMINFFLWCSAFINRLHFIMKETSVLNATEP